MTLNMRIMSNLDSILITFWLPSDLVSVQGDHFEFDVGLTCVNLLFSF